jgi:acetyl esterase/lipase
MAYWRGNVVVLLLVVVCLLWATGCATNKVSSGTVAPPTLHNGIVYTQAGDSDLMLDIAVPSEGGGPFPAIVFFCSNGWGYYSYGDRRQFSYPLEKCAQRGYVAVTADVRSTKFTQAGKPLYRFPDQVFDAKCVIRWLRANADKYRIDPDRVGTIGWGSGGYLSLMLGLTDPSDGLEGDCGDLGISSRVQAVVSFAGITELSSQFREARNPVWTSDFMGGTPEDMPEQYAKASPLTYVSKDDPPVLTLHGSEDVYIPANQATLLDARMREVGASHTLVIKDGFDHFNFYNEPIVWEFMDRYLKNSM